MSFNIQKAFEYYKKFIVNEEREKRFALLKEYNFRSNGSVNSLDWELCVAILTNDRGREEEYGVDLVNYEVKSAVEGENFDYHYFCKNGIKKIQQEMMVDHIFVSYSADYSNINIRMITKNKLKYIFKKWEKEIKLFFQNDYNNKKTPNSHYRNYMPYKTVMSEGNLIMCINNSQLELVT